MPQPLQEAADSDHRGVEKLGEQQEDSHQGTGYKGLVLRVMGGSDPRCSPLGNPACRAEFQI